MGPACARQVLGVGLCYVLQFPDGEMTAIPDQALWERNTNGLYQKMCLCVCVCVHVHAPSCSVL